MRTFLLGAVICLAAAPAAAQRTTTPPQRPRAAAVQRWAERVFVSINGGYQAPTNDFSDSLNFPSYRETGTTESRYPMNGGVTIDGGVAVRLWKQVGAGVAVSRFTSSGTAHTVSRVPHPFFRNQLREAAGDVRDVTRNETGVHAQIIYLARPSRKLRLALSGGPSWLNVEQEMVTSVNFDETYPYDVAAFKSALTRRIKRSAIGFNAAADVMWMFGRKIGAGALVRFSRATVELTPAPDRTVSVDAGGAQAGAGIRLLF